ncbi:MAG: AraC family transcriptional regulator [Lachnospiraceae bacterium]|jgi:AraC family transcriptional regulator|nr:AraC family transcriptional regulator [Lachnospiraceae bacterium]
MKWLEQFNDALTYMEDNLDGEISYEEAARRAGSSVYHFQRMFSYLTGVPLSEYLRRRRMTKAAFDLQQGSKVLEVALRYGYESPTAFNRAFQAVHGSAPSAAYKSDTVLKSFSRIGFQFSIKGEEEMEYRIVKKESFRVVGVREPIQIAPLTSKSGMGKDFDPADVAESFKRVPLFWQESGQNGKLAQVCGLIEKEPLGLLGISDCTEEGGSSYYYIAAATDRAVPEGMYECVVPACTWAVFSGAGLPSSIADLQKRIFAEWLPASGYEWDNAPDIEVYLDDNPEYMKYEVWLPVVSKI